MVTLNLEQRARELLAAEYERDGRPSDADFMRLGLPVCDADIRALRAIVAALRQQPAPVVDDARMARALEWARDVAQGMPASAAKEHLPAIEEAIAAYDPSCGARTVRVVDEGNGVRACPVLIAARAHDVGTTGVLRGNADLVPAEHKYLTTRPENNHESY